MKNQAFIIPTPLQLKRFTSATGNRSVFSKNIYSKPSLHRRTHVSLRNFATVHCCASEFDEDIEIPEEDKHEHDFPIELTPEEIALCENLPEDIPIINKIVLVGRLGADPELRRVGDNMQVCKFTMAVQNEYDPDDDEGPDSVSWFNVEIWGRLGQYAANSSRKGIRVGVQGSFNINSWTGRDGQLRYSYVVTAESFEILQSKSERSTFTSNGSEMFSKKSSQQGFGKYETDERDLTDLPF